MEDVKLELEHTINDTQMSLDTKAMSSNTKTMTYFGEDDDNDEEISLTWDDGINSNDEDEEIGLTWDDGTDEDEDEEIGLAWDDGTDEDEGEISLNQTILKSSTEVRDCTLAQVSASNANEISPSEPKETSHISTQIEESRETPMPVEQPVEISHISTQIEESQETPMPVEEHSIPDQNVQRMTYADIKKDRLNNVIIPSSNSNEEVVSLTDLAKLTPICKEYLSYMKKHGYSPENESFNDFCQRTKEVVFLGYTDKEIQEKLEEDVITENSSFTNVELVTLAQYLKSVRNINLEPNLLQYYINYPIDFFDKIAFTFRTASYKEIELISENYNEPWYKDYIVPLFSLEEKDTPLLIELMKQGKFNENEALQYTNDLGKLNEYLTLKLNGGYVQDIFNKIGTNREDMELYRIFTNVVGDAEIAQTLFSKSSNDKIVIAEYLQKIHKEFPDNKIRLTDGTQIELLDFLRRYENDIYFIDLLKGLSNGIFDPQLYNAITLVQPDNKKITTGLLKYYAEHPALAQYFRTYQDVCTSIIANDIDCFGYDLAQFRQDMSTDNNADPEITKTVYKAIVCYYYSDMFGMTLIDYKQWIALFSQDYKRYTETIAEYANFDAVHFNKFWSLYIANYFGVKDLEIGNNVCRNFVIKIQENRVELVLPIDIFIYMDDNVISSLNNIKNDINCVKYDSENNLLYLGKRNLFGKHTRPLAMLKSSLEHLAEKDSLKDYNMEDYGIQSRSIFLKYFNMFVIGDNIELFYSKESSLYEMDKASCMENFKENCRLLTEYKFSSYITYDAMFYVMYKVEPSYSLLAYCQDANAFCWCLKTLRLLYYRDADSLVLFTRFIYALYGKNLAQIRQFCKSKSIIVLNDEWFNRTYNNPISLEIFLKHIDRFYKMARNLKTELSIDSSTGYMCIDYKLQ